MKFLLISIILLSFQVSSITVNSTDACLCTTVQLQKDCLNNPKCEWDSTTQKCKTATTTTTTRFQSKLCTDSKACTKQQGCAFSDNKCIIMGDCQSYLGTSNAECQKYSFRCNWDKTEKKCTSSDVCSQYGGEGQQTECESVTQWNGDKWCKFDTKENKCSTKVCADYEKTTDADCIAALQDAKCVSDKKKCLPQLVNCETYSADLCLSVSASNGPCELKSTDKTKCQSKTCEGATDSKTDSGCDAYVKGCITNNLTCVKTLPSCTTYSATDCPQLKGNAGSCKLTSDQTPTCRDQKCEDFTESTDEACNAKKLSCKTNGVHCVSGLAAKCDSQTANCDSIFTAEGKCKSTDTAKCALNECASQIKTTNEDCGKYSGTAAATCITNGVACVISLADTCATITITPSSTCDQYISKEGKCKLKDGSTSTCELNPCNSQTFTSDDECKKYSSHDVAPAVVCKTNGVRCLDNLKTCDSYLKTDVCSTLKGSDGQCMDDPADGSTKCKIATCDKITSPSAVTCPAGNSTCKFDGVNCVSALKTCENYTANCDKMISSNAKTCTTNPTDATKCAVKTCATAPTSTSTNEDCIKYLVGCFTTGQGCIEQLSTCSSYKGIKTTCEKYIGTDGKCTADETNKAEDKCKPKDCANATSVTNDQQCNTYSNLCFYNAKNQKCSKKVATCGGGTTKLTQAECESVITSESSVYCVWKGTECVQATCNTVQNVKSKEGCAVYGANCEFDNISGCKDKTNYTCSSLRSASICLQDSALNACVWDTTNSACIQYNKCSDYPLTPVKDTEVKTTDQISEETKICNLLSNQCYSIGGNTCVSKTPCSAIKEEKSCIGKIGIDDKICGWDAKALVCKTFGQCTDVELLTHSDCQKYSPTCTSDSKTCTAIKNCADATTKELCDLGGIDGKCFWSGTACSLWTCINGTGTTHDTCYKLSASCTTDGTKCMSIGECSSYTDKNCVLGLKNTPCFYDSQKSACRNKVCADYTSVTGQADCDIAGCAYDPDAKACMAIDKCSTYKKETICNINKQTDKKECVWKVGKTTAEGCLELTQCSYASSNKDKCEKINCYYVPSVTNGTTTTDAECKTMDCYGKNPLVTTKSLCNPFKTTSSDGKNETITFCTWSDTSKKCTEGDPSGDLTVDNCFVLSKYTYYWSTTSSKCVSCKGGNTQTNNTTNGTNNGTNNGTTTTDSKGFTLDIIIYILLLFQLM